MKYEAPEEIRLQNSRAALTLVYRGNAKSLPAEFLRVYSPSAEVRGHGPGQETLQTGKAYVTIDGLEPVGQYALKITFSDGHDSGLYDWDYLYKLAHEYDTMWADYLRLIEAAGASRIPTAADGAAPAPQHGCGSGSCGKH
ncbi:gamma-butyrobetaine hydroxylase-like domain-containing protein [Neisseria dentiae]|uniref:gamma-butyrobetaine hydroxylase-like domain-containing protein n=1 Tax=Neisseria dentiae TaxID=194197 RepID=UPI00359F73DD